MVENVSPAKAISNGSLHDRYHEQSSEESEKDTKLHDAQARQRSLQPESVPFARAAFHEPLLPRLQSAPTLV